MHPEAPWVPVESFEFSRRHSGRDLVIRGDVYRATDAQDGVVFCHGFKGFARWGFYAYLAPHVAARGLNAVTFDFSGSGVGPDRETYTQREEFARNTYTQELADVDAVVGHARECGWIGKRYGVFGHSRGGGDAILHASRSADVGALVTWAAVGHVLRWMPHEVTLWRERGYTEIVNARTGDVLPLNVTFLDECEQLHDTELNIEQAASAVRAPWLLVHGSDDESVSVDDARRLQQAAAGSGEVNLKVEIIQGANHVFGAAHPLGSIPPVLRELTTLTAGFLSTQLRGE